MSLPSVSLFFQQGSSDKVYHARVEAEGDGFIVAFEYGRRGSTLTAGRKTTAPVPLDEATKVFDKLVHSKTSKGYTPEEGAAPHVGGENAGRVSGLLPQLLNVIDQATVERLIRDDAWCMQRKHDGVRLMLRCADGEVTGINRKGLTVGLPASVVDAARAIGLKDAILDGELVNDTLHVWDVLRHNGASLANAPLRDRLDVLDALVPLGGAIQRELSAMTTAAKNPVFGEADMKGWEGVVFKRLDAPYTVGRPSSGGDALKFKFTTTATFRVRATNATKRSVAMEMTDTEGVWIDVGNVTIPPNHAVPPVGEICEARYLYAYRGGALFQPVYCGTRADQDDTDCGVSQLQYKGEERAAA